MLKTTWNTGSKDIIDFNDIIEHIKKHTLLNGTIYIGTDSFFIKNKCIFSTAICLYGADKQNTINLANHIVELIPSAELELHLDISPQEKNEGTSHLANMLIGYIKGSGYECRVKPDAFAAASIADKHSK